MHLEYPKWVKVEGPGHPQNPGHVLVENEDQEREVAAGGVAPRELNPADAAKAEPEGEKSIDDMGREDLISTLVRESITDDVTDDQLRDSIKHLRNRQDDRAPGDERDGGDPLKDAEGKDVPPPATEEANKGKNDAVEDRQAPEAKAFPATDARPRKPRTRFPTASPPAT